MRTGFIRFATSIILISPARVDARQCTCLPPKPPFRTSWFGPTGTLSSCGEMLWWWLVLVDRGTDVQRMVAPMPAVRNTDARGLALPNVFGAICLSLICCRSVSLSLVVGRSLTQTPAQSFDSLPVPSHVASRLRRMAGDRRWQCRVWRRGGAGASERPIVWASTTGASSVGIVKV
mgnify:CR=1 FL=1